MRAVMVNTVIDPALQERATAMLAKAKTVEAIGPRPSEDRPLFKKLLRTGMGLALGLAIAQTAPIKAIENALIDFLSAPQAEAPIPSLGAAVWVSAEPSPWWVAASTNEGQVDFSALKSLFQEQGLTAIQARSVLAHMSALQDVWVLGRPSPDLLAQAAADQDANRKWLDQSWSNPETLPALMKADTDAGFVFSQNPKQAAWSTLSEDERWDALSLAWLQSEMSVEQHAAPTALRVPGATLSLEQAQDALRLAVQDAGLAALRVPMTIREDPKALHQFAVRLKAANQELSAVTGWSGGVLGLNHRVVLDMTSLFDGTTYLDASGRIHVQAWWPSLGHEWFHALDFAERSVLAHPKDGRTLSQQIDLTVDPSPQSSDPSMIRASQHKLWTSITQPSLSSSQRAQIAEIARSDAPLQAAPSTPMFKALAQIDQTAGQQVPVLGSPWLTWRRSAVEILPTVETRPLLSFTESSSAAYLNSPTEILAFSFSGHLRVSLTAPSQVLTPLSAIRPSSVSYEPTAVEASAVKEAWSAHFRAGQSWWSADQKARSAPPAPQVAEPVMDLSPLAKAWH